MPLDPGARRAILDACDALRDGTLETITRLVRHPSTLGNEQGANREMARQFEALGLAPHRVPIAPTDDPIFSPPLLPYAGRENVVALHQPRAVRGRSLVLQGHVDVVPEGAADMWASPPYAAEIRNGRIYGRGAGDMKGGIAAYLSAFAALRLAGLAPAAPVQLQAVIEEECTGNGAAACLLALPACDAAIIPEPGPGVEAMWTAEVGVVWAWVTVSGRPAHVRDMQAGLNAIEAASVIAGAFKDYEAERNRAEHIHAAFHGVNHPLNVNLGSIEGGEWVSSVPTRCRIGLRVGVMLGYSAARTRADIEALVARAATHERLRGATLKLEFRGFMAEPCRFDQQAEIVTLCRRAWADATGGSLRDYAAPALTDGRHFVARGTPTAVFGPDAQDIHGIDESVGVESIHGCTRTIALAMAEWCGLELASAAAAGGPGAGGCSG